VTMTSGLLVVAAVAIGTSDVKLLLAEGATIGDLEKITRKYKFPVGVEWQGVFYEDEEGDNGHYCIITEVDRSKNYLKLSDPYRKFAGVDRKIRISDFEKRWWDSNEIAIPYSKLKKLVYDRKLIFLITSKKATFPRNLGMVRVN